MKGSVGIDAREVTGLDICFRQLKKMRLLMWEGLDGWRVLARNFFTVRGIMVETSTSWIKGSHFAEMFVLVYLLRKNMAPREIQTLTLAGAIKREQKGSRQELKVIRGS